MTHTIRNSAEEAATHYNDAKWFISKADHEADWDIKVQDSWEKTIGITYPGSYDSSVVVDGNIFTPEQLGNIMYGYTGTAMGLSLLLIPGSVYAAGGIDKNEFADWPYILLGEDWYYRDGNY